MATCVLRERAYVCMRPVCYVSVPMCVGDLCVTRACARAYVRLRERAYVRMQTCVCERVCMHVCMYVCVCVSLCFE